MPQLPSKTEKIILGIDPGTNIMGYGVLKVCGNKASMETMGVIDLRKYASPYLKLGRIFERVTGIIEYAPLKIKMAITGNGQASKEQVAGMLTRMLHIRQEDLLPYMDATDGLAAAYCHFLQMGKPTTEKNYSSWKDFIRKNPEKVKGL